MLKLIKWSCLSVLYIVVVGYTYNNIDSFYHHRQSREVNEDLFPIAQTQPKKKNPN